MAASVGGRPEGERRNGPRGRRKVDTGFKSLRDLMICCVGMWAFWFQVTRVAKPDRFILAASILLMVTPSATAVYRVVNAVLSSNARVLREGEREDNL